MTIEIKTTEIPATARTGRTPMPNPFIEAFPSDDKALTFVVAEGRDSREANRAIRQVRAAAKAVNRTGRIVMKDVEGGVEFTVWTIERMTRKASQKRETVTDAQAEKAAVAAVAKVAAKKAPAKKATAAKG